MATKNQIQRIQKNGTGAAVSSDKLDATKTETMVEVGFPAEKLTVVTTGDLVANVTPMVGAADAHGAIAANGTPSTTTTTNMFTSVKVERTSGEGSVAILAK